MPPEEHQTHFLLPQLLVMMMICTAELKPFHFEAFIMSLRDMLEIFDVPFLLPSFPKYMVNANQVLK
ncbi:hypothetical protein SCA6_003595 [Theobroma cacao]